MDIIYKVEPLSLTSDVYTWIQVTDRNKGEIVVDSGYRLGRFEAYKLPPPSV